ncbi:MAG: YbfB/YjiJ family MFS transporter, partial [Actinomycetota bacterium]|nr:YbfB/YjiJ family MFS transporter [Actinomycetota bacterium]
MTGAEQKNGGRTAEEASLLLLRPLAAGMLALVVAMGVGRFAYTPILPGMQEALDLGDRQTGALASSNYLGYLVGAVLTAVFPLGSWRDAALRACLVAVVATTGLMALTTGFAAWAALRFLAGVASAGVFVLASGVVLGVLRERGRSDLSGWLYSGVGIGIAAAGLTVLALHGLLPEGAPAGWRA